jgi:glucosamine--fructose-6-phosphate aminotransferase (isomerizing)
MLTEILEQPEIIKKLIAANLPPNAPVKGLKLNISDEEILNLSKIYIVASGSSRNVGNIAKYLFTSLVKLPILTDYASEFAHKELFLKSNDLVIAISQSGETADTYQALKIAKEKGAHTLALTNNPESKIHKLAESAMEVRAGSEKSIASTKAFTAQLINLYILAFYLGEKRGAIEHDLLSALKNELNKVPDNINKIFESIDQIEEIADKLKNARSIVMTGRGINYATAREGALKTKEITYIDSNGYPSGEFLHGHMAFVDELVPIVSTITGKNHNRINYDLAIKNTEEVKLKRNPSLVIIKNTDDNEIEEIAAFKDAYFINIPEASELVSPVFAVVCMQILALKLAEKLGRNIDQPRSLNKVVSSE